MALFTVRRNLANVLCRALSSPPPSHTQLAVPFFNLQSPVQNQTLTPFNTQSYTKTSGSGYSPLNDSSPNRSNRPPKEMILLDCCDIVPEFPTDPKPSEEEMVSTYVKALAAVAKSVVPMPGLHLVKSGFDVYMPHDFIASLR